MMADPWILQHLYCDDLHLEVLPAIGGRLWDVQFQGRSLLFQNPDLLGVPVDLTDLGALPTRSPQFAFPLWGGEKTWLAPDTAWQDGAPYRQLDSGPYRIASQTNMQIELQSDVCSISHLSVRRQITVESRHEWTIMHTVTNHGTEPRMTGIWSVMMLDTPTRVGVAMPNPKVEPVFGETGSRLSMADTHVIAECDRLQEFKVGLPNPDGATLMRCGQDRVWLMCQVPQPLARDSYAHGQPLEIFNSGDYPYCEAEWHSPCRSLVPYETLSFHQRFHVWMNDCPSDLCDTIGLNKELLTCMS
jgi:hypothetical protein